MAQEIVNAFDLDSFRETIAHIEQVDALGEPVSQGVKSLGFYAFDAFSLERATLDAPYSGTNFWLCDYDRFGLHKRYLSSRYLTTDPSIAVYAKTIAPFDLMEHFRQSPKNASVLWQLATAKLLGVKRAWAVPLSTIEAIRGVTFYMRGDSEAQRETFAKSRDIMQLIASSLFERIDAINRAANNLPAGDEDRPNRLAHLTSRELDCLHWAAQGKTNWEIGEILEISENTVRFHFKNIFAKLEVSSRSQAVGRLAESSIQSTTAIGG